MSEPKFVGLTEAEWMALREDALELKARMGTERKAAKGILHGCAPLGYKNAMIGGEKVIVIDPETAPKVREPLRLAARERTSIRDLVSVAAAMGLRSRNGKPLGASSIHAIVRNPFYAGFAKRGDSWVRGAHETIVPKGFFHAI